MSEPHVCTFYFEKNVQHVHIDGMPATPTGAVAASRAGKYSCPCGAWQLGAPQHRVKHLPPDDSEGGEI